MKRLATLIVSVLMLTLASISSVRATAWAGPDPVDWGVPLKEAKTYILVGTVSDGSCVFDYPDITLAEDDVWWTTRVLAIDLANCQEFIKEGIRSSAPEMPTGKGYAFDTEAAEPPVQGDDGPETLLVSGTKKATHAVQWVDPARLAVNWVQNDLTWSYDGDCAYFNSDIGTFDWFWEDGWYRISHSTTQSHSTACDWWQGQSTARYQNDIFCSESTWAIYSYVRVKGWSNGTATYARSTVVNGTGICYTLLKMEHSEHLQSL